MTSRRPASPGAAAPPKGTPIKIPASRLSRRDLLYAADATAVTGLASKTVDPRSGIGVNEHVTNLKFTESEER
jgi:hypothetical protein